jgi:outer membrane cobalamin receptor
MKIVLTFLFTAFLLCIGAFSTFAQKDSLFTLPAEDILKMAVNSTDMEVSIANKRKQSLAQAPAIVTVITEREILQYGCRDIADILRLIPGFEFGIDVQSLFGLGFRGVWAHEGKALIMINNTPINCFGYGNNNYFGSLPSAMIDRVEVIRGPGSTLYGGFAEVAVINIITKNGNRLRGVEIQTWLGALSTKELVRGGNLSAGITKDQLDFSFHVGTNVTPTSVRKYVDYADNFYQMGNNTSWRRWSHIIAEGTYRNFYFSYNRSEQDFMAQDIFGFIPKNPVTGIYSNQLNFKVETLRAHYEFWVGKKLRLKPNIEIARGNPISTSNSTIAYPNISPTTYLNPADLWQNASVYARRYQAELELTYNISERDEILGGIGGQNNTLYCISAQGSNGLQTSTNPADTTSFMARGTFYAFAQYTRQGKEMGFTTGARFEHTPFGNTFLPRMGLTYIKSKFNAKLLYGRAFRVPLLYQAFTRQYTAGSLVPEITNTFDLEIGYKWNKATYLRANAFHTQIDKPITYIGANNSYQNYGSVRTVGIESELKYQTEHYQFFTNLAYARPVKRFTNVDFMNQASNAFLALPTLKINAGGSLTYQKLTIGSTLTWLSPRHAQTKNSALVSTPTNVLLETTQHPALWLCNINILLSNIITQGVSLRLTGYNVLNAPYVALQPYYGGHAPMPVNDRQIDLALILKL